MSGVGQNPNMLVTPGISPPYPFWDALKVYYVGDVVTYADQYWVCLFYADNVAQNVEIGQPPDLYPITLNPVPGGLGPGIYVPIPAGPVNANTVGGRWVNLSLATPPYPVWSPTTDYKIGDTVMYPAWSPGSYWRASAANVGRIPKLPYFDPSAVPPKIAPQYWSPLNPLQNTFFPEVNAIVKAPAKGYIGQPQGPILPPINFSATSGQTTTVPLFWDVVGGQVYDAFTITNTTLGTSVSVLGNIFTYVWSGLLTNTVYNFSIVGILSTLTSPPATATATTGTGSTPPKFTALDWYPLNVPTGTLNLADIFLNLGTSTSVNIVQNYSTVPVTLVSGVTGTFIPIVGSPVGTYTYPNNLVAVDSTTSSIVSPPVSLVYNQGSIFVTSFSVSLGTAGDSNLISWDSPVAPTPIVGSPAIINAAFIYQLYVTVNGGGPTSLRIDGLVQGVQSYTDTTGYAEADVLVYYLVPAMTYGVNGVGGCSINQRGVVLQDGGVVPP
jgi:hypothetical protein